MERGHDAIHTFDLPDGNRTPDQDIREIADVTGRIVVTKDRDFVDSFMVEGSPARLIFVTTGNIGNDEWIQLFTSRIPEIESSFRSARFLELGRLALLVRA